MGTSALPMARHLGTVQRKKRCPSLRFYLKGDWMHTFLAAAWGLASNQPTCRGWIWSSQLGHWWVLAHPQVFRATKNKDSGFYHLKDMRGNQDLRPGWLTTGEQFVKTERWELIYLMRGNEHREERKMKKQGNMFQTKVETYWFQTIL